MQPTRTAATMALLINFWSVMKSTLQAHTMAILIAAMGVSIDVDQHLCGFL
jgi:preprotein translocase subunit SecD